MGIEFTRLKFNYSRELVHSMNKGYATLLGNELVNILSEHRRLTGAQAYSSNNMGYFAAPLYVFRLNFKPQGMTMAPLPASLEGVHAEWLHGYTQFTHEAKRVSQQVLSLLGKATSFQEFRDMLPDAVYHCFPDDHPMNQLTRSRPGLYSCGLDADQGHWDPKMVADYKAIAPLVDIFFGYTLL